MSLRYTTYPPSAPTAPRQTAASPSPPRYYQARFISTVDQSNVIVHAWAVFISCPCGVIRHPPSALKFVSCPTVHISHIVLFSCVGRLPMRPSIAVRRHAGSRTLLFGEKYPPRNFPDKLRLVVNVLTPALQTNFITSRNSAIPTLFYYYAMQKVDYASHIIIQSSKKLNEASKEQEEAEV